VEDSKPFSVSIILRTRNEARHLAATLSAIRAQEYPGAVECIVIDSCSTDETRAIARRWGCEKLLLISRADFSFGRALNRAAEQARGDILVALSAHARPADERWLAHLLRPFANPRVGGVYGRQLPYPDAYPPLVVDCQRWYGEVRLTHETVEQAFFSNANSAWRRTLWQQLPFDETLPACEDQAWARQVIERGHCIVYEPLAAVYHSHNEPFWQVYNRQAREERGRRQIMPDRRVTCRDFLADWYQACRTDARHILATRRQWLWLVLSPCYRFCWSFGRWCIGT